MAREPRGRRTWRIARWAAVVLAVAAIGVVLLLKSAPDPYRRTEPMGVDREALRQFNTGVVNQVGNVLLDESGGTRLDLAITEPMINARIAQFLADEIRAGRAVPPALEHLRVGFEPGVVVLATRLGGGWSSVVVSQRLRLEADDAGRLVVRPVGASAGRLPLPLAPLEPLRQAAAQALEQAPGEAAGDEDDVSRLWRAVLDALDGEPVFLGSGKRRIALEDVEVERGTLRVTGHRSER
ncbi:MAG: hypothetical protein ISS74_01590 [Planctomycetes bacterium]|nr:hypothetical protein [Planctomycetota bacterium]